MQKRISRRDVDEMAHRLNEALGLPVDYWRDGESQVGNIHAEEVAGYLNILQTVSTGGACKQLAGGFTRREAHRWLMAAADGVRLARDPLSGCPGR